MPGREHSDWYPPALIVGTALATFLLGLATAMWLFATPLPAVVGPAVLAQGAARARGAQQATLPAGSAAGAAQASTGQGTGSGSPPAAESRAVSPSPPRPAAAASSSPGSAASTALPQPPAAAAAASAAGSAAAQTGGFSLQFGAFLDQAKAKSLADQLAAKGYAPVSVDAADGYGRTWHYVRLGAFADERAAALAASDLLEQAGIGATVVRVAAANAGG
jgi:cell division protein FtsN